MIALAAVVGTAIPIAAWAFMAALSARALSWPAREPEAELEDAA